MMISGACQFANSVTTQAVTNGLRIDPICPVVFMEAPRTAVCSPPISMHVAQLALSVNMEAATATAISDAAITDVAEKTDRNIAAPATAYPAKPTVQRPAR